MSTVLSYKIKILYNIMPNRSQRRSLRPTRRRSRTPSLSPSRLFTTRINLPDLYHSKTSQINWNDFLGRPFVIFENGNVRKRGTSFKDIRSNRADFIISHDVNGANNVEYLMSTPQKTFTIGFRPN